MKYDDQQAWSTQPKCRQMNLSSQDPTVRIRHHTLPGWPADESSVGHHLSIGHASTLQPKFMVAETLATIFRNAIDMLKAHTNVVAIETRLEGDHVADL